MKLKEDWCAMEDNRDNRNQERDNRDRGGYNNRPRGGNRFNNRHSGGGHHGGRGGRSQRPLLTSSINAAGMSLVALAFLLSTKEHFHNVQLLGWAVVLFGLSAFVYYIAQRVKPSFVEKLSDLCFLGGVVVVVWVAISLSGIFGAAPL